MALAPSEQTPEAQASEDSADYCSSSDYFIDSKLCLWSYKDGMSIVILVHAVPM